METDQPPLCALRQHSFFDGPLFKRGDRGIPTAPVQRGPAFVPVLVSLKSGAVGRFLLRPSDLLYPCNQEGGQTAVYCAHPASTCRSCALCEQEGQSGPPSILDPSEAARCGSTGIHWSPRAFP